MVALLMSPKTGFAQRLRTLRTEAGLTQADLAQRAGLHLQGLVKLERGEREPTWATVIALAKALRVTTDAFLTDDGPTEPEPRPRGRPKRSDEDASDRAKRRRPKKG